MTMTDPISDMLTRIRNGNKAKKESVDIPSSKVKIEIARVLKEQGYIDTYKVTGDKKKNTLRVYLKYDSEENRVIDKINRISKPGRRMYSAKEEIPNVLGGMGIAIVSTSKGIMTGFSAKKMGVGGEILCYVW
ncbi:30S ribosomal protein S8 [Chlamydiota bacterium]